MSIKYCASEIKTFRVLNPGMPSIGTSAAWAGRSEWSLRSSQFALGKVPKYLPYWTYLIIHDMHEGTPDDISRTTHSIALVDPSFCLSQRAL